MTEPQIDVRLEHIGTERLDDRWAVWLRVTFTNVGGGVFDVDRLTACDGGHIANHVFAVRQGDAEIDYQGMMVKRAPPGPDGFFHVAAGEAEAVEVNIGEVYALPASGEIAIRFDHTNHFSEQGGQLVSNEITVRLG